VLNDNLTREASDLISCNRMLTLLRKFGLESSNNRNAIERWLLQDDKRMVRTICEIVLYALQKSTVSADRSKTAAHILRFLAVNRVLPDDFERTYFTDFLDCISDMKELNAFETSHLLWSWGKTCSLAPSQEFMNEWEESFFYNKDQIEATLLSNAMYACGKLAPKFAPSLQFLQTCDQLVVKNAAGFDAVSLSVLLWSFGRIALGQSKYRLSEKALSVFYSRFCDSRLEFQPESLHQVFWAVHAMNLRPPREFYMRFYESCDKQLPFFSSSTVIELMKLFGDANVQPPRHILELWSFRYRQCAARLRISQHLIVIRALMKMRWSRTPGLLSEVTFPLLEKELGVLSQPQLSELNRYCKRLELLTTKQSSSDDRTVSTSVFPALEQEIAQRLATAESPEVFLRTAEQRMFSGASRDDDMSKSAVVQRFCELSTSFSARELTRMLSLLVSLKYKPEDQFWNAWYKAYAERCHTKMTGSDLTVILWSFGKLGVMPRSDFLALWFNDLNSRELDLLGIVQLFWATVKLKLAVPENEWLRWCELLEHRMPEFNARQFAVSTWALGEIPRSFPTSLLSVWFAKFIDIEPSLNSTNVENILKGLCGFPVRPSPQVQSAIEKAFLSRLGVAEPRNLAQGAISLAVLKPDLSDEFWAQWSMAVKAKPKRFRFRDSIDILQLLAQRSITVADAPWISDLCDNFDPERIAPADLVHAAEAMTLVGLTLAPEKQASWRDSLARAEGSGPLAISADLRRRFFGIDASA